MKERTAGSNPSTSSQLPFGPKTLLLGASALVLYGISRRSKPGIALATAGGILALTAVKAQTSSSSQTATATFLVNAPAERAYELWRNLENLPQFMAHLKSVRVIDEAHSEWTALGPLDREVRWNAQITIDRPNEMIAWQSQPNSPVQTHGSVEFRSDPQKRGTFVTAEVHYRAPGGTLGRALASMFGKHPEFMIREDLRRFKSLLEAGETPTTAGQTHGPRGLHGHAEQVLFRETSNHPRPQAQPAFSTARKSA